MPFDITLADHPWALEHLTQQEHQALMKVRHDMLLGQISPEDFDMRSFTIEGGDPVYDPLHTICGTTHCIGGWMTLYMGVPKSIAVGLYCDPRFNSLFFGFTRSCNGKLPEIADAVEAIQRFLSTGVGWVRHGPAKQRYSSYHRYH